MSSWKREGRLVVVGRGQKRVMGCYHKFGVVLLESPHITREIRVTFWGLSIINKIT